MTKKNITITMNNRTFSIPNDIAEVILTAIEQYEVEKLAQTEAEALANALASTKSSKPATQSSTKSKGKGKAQPKADDNFDRAKYEATAKQLGCFGKHGVWKCCRPTVYKVMDGSLSLAKAKAEVKKIATEKGWELSK